VAPSTDKMGVPGHPKDPKKWGSRDITRVGGTLPRTRASGNGDTTGPGHRDVFWGGLYVRDIPAPPAKLILKGRFLFSLSREVPGTTIPA